MDTSPIFPLLHKQQCFKVKTEFYQGFYLVWKRLLTIQPISSNSSLHNIKPMIHYQDFMILVDIARRLEFKARSTIFEDSF